MQEPTIAQLARGWRTMAPVHYDLPDGSSVTVRAGYDTDLASIPRLLWSVPGWSPWELSLAAPLIHDFLYRCGGVPPKGSVEPRWRCYTRAQVDRIFYDIMREQGIGRWRAAVAYAAVRAGGFLAWQGARNDGAKG